MANKQGTISATGSANAIAMAFTPGDTQCVIELSGTFTSTTIQVQLLGTDGNWYNVGVVDLSSLLFDSGGTVNIGTSTTTMLLVPYCALFSQVRVYATAGSGLSLSVQFNSNNVSVAPPVTANANVSTTISSPATITVSSANALAAGPNGATNPSFNVDSSAGSAATGINIVAAAAASGVSIKAISSGSNENLKIDAKGTGTLTIQGTATGAAFCGQSFTVNGAAVGLGYSTGAGGTVTQTTSKSTGVTLNKATGQITTHNASLASSTTVTFALTNSVIAATDVVHVVVGSGEATPGSYQVWASQLAGGSCNINIRNITGGALGEALVLNFVVLKGATS